MPARKKHNERISMPEHVDPMLCTLVEEPVENEAYIFELKWDGYRIVSRVENNHCVFDLLYLDGNSLMDLPLYQRKGLLNTNIKAKNTRILQTMLSFDV